MTLALLFAWLAGALAPAARAQEDQPGGPVYIVQDGDSLWDIAARFGVSMQDLAAANGISDPGQLATGAQLVIPGLEGIQGVLVTETVPFGETLSSLSRRYEVGTDVLARLNHLTSPDELYPGYILVIPETGEQAATGGRAMLAQGQSLLELAVENGANPWALALHNRLLSPWRSVAGEVLRLPPASSGEAKQDGPGALPGTITAAVLKPTPLVQGKAAVLELDGPPGMMLSGTLAGKALHFFSGEEGKYTALQGLHALLEPGIYPLTLSGQFADGKAFSFSQAVFVREGDYPFDPVLTVSPETIDPAVTKPEDAEWTALAQAASPEAFWDGAFLSPVPPEFKDCWPSRFGNRRSYNGSAYTYSHSGLDFCGGEGTKIYAPAAGVVVFAGPLTVRGNATMIDHGWGVYTGYMHQSEIDVKPGDKVEAGQVIGLVGRTGRVTGPHLHWEVWVGGVQVDPMDWLEGDFP